MKEEQKIVSEDLFEKFRKILDEEGIEKFELERSRLIRETIEKSKNKDLLLKLQWRIDQYRKLNYDKPLKVVIEISNMLEKKFFNELVPLLRENFLLKDRAKETELTAEEKSKLLSCFEKRAKIIKVDFSKRKGQK